MTDLQTWIEKERAKDPEGFDAAMAEAHRKIDSGEIVVSIHEVPEPTIWNRLKLWFRRSV